MSERWKKQAFSIADMRRLAMRALPRPVFDFADGAAEDERTLARNEAAFDDWDFIPRPLDAPARRDLSVELFGHRLALPVMIGPTGLSGLFAVDGERAAARAAQAAGTAFCLSHASVCTMEDLAATGMAPRWMQIFVYRERGFTQWFVQRAAASNYDALVLTVDNQLLGNRERDLRNGFTIPPNFSVPDMMAMLGKLPWLLAMRKELPKITFANYIREGEAADLASLSKRMASLLDPGLSWRDVEWLRGLWKKPFLLKGILSPVEARKAVELGVDGIIVSNHGGRQLDGSIAGLDALPAIVEAVDGRIPVLVDGGLRRGADVVKAMILGARATLIGRPQLYGLAVGGEAGVAHVLDIYRREIDRVMGLLGVSKLSDLDASHLARRQKP
ncbi:hypothetical protein C3941_11860 [Kaistia algarum]|uniref:alpha-hydroxy acid oxidase n=1 Tax=Kaistia algarum TaxID=2083279 RepID=UPI000CE8DAAB|nr:alpha-hydroxy acid oxidase [Kaistia algarum]MCX5515042.1 alpha-hydroxy acid oxidase [Kaistia algarum]PPE79778.1 hypothetical protein C3941_11860 [Kaistia algarum]